jgi:hypothetical protein
MRKVLVVTGGVCLALLGGYTVKASADSSSSPTAAGGTQSCRNYWEQPGGNGSVWNTPLGSGAQWGSASDADTRDARQGGIINPAHEFGNPIYVGSATDPVKTYPGEDGKTYKIHVPANAAGGGGNNYTDNALNLMDPAGNFGKVFSLEHSNTKVAEVDDGTADNFGEDQETGLTGIETAAGTMNAYDMKQVGAGGHIRHMLQYATDAKYLKNAAADGVFKLGPSSWPQAYEDYQSQVNAPGVDPNVNLYTGNLAAGTTLGIPMDAQMPAGLTKGGQELFWTLQHYGALFRNQAGGGIHFATNWDSDNDPLTEDMRKDAPAIVQYLAPLRNQHVGGKSFTSSPKNAPGQRVDSGPVSLCGTAPSSSPTPSASTTPSATSTPTGTATPTMTAQPTGSSSSTGSGAASPDGTVVTAGSSEAITDTAGRRWTVDADGLVDVDATPDRTTARVTRLAYVGGKVWQENADQLWWAKTSPTDQWSPTDGTSTSPLSGETASPTRSSASSSPTATATDGPTATATDGPTATATDGPTATATDGPTPTTSAPTPSSTTSRPASADGSVAVRGSGRITDAAGTTWTVSRTGHVMVDGKADTRARRAAGLVYLGSVIWRFDSNGHWFLTAGAGRPWFRVF